MKLLDKNTSSAVSVAQVASNPRVNGRNLTEMQVFLCPTDERLSGVGVIQHLFAGNIPAVSIDGLRHPAALKADQLKKQWRYTMQTVNVSDAVNDCAYVLSFLDAAFTFPQRQQITLSYDAHCGLSLILADLSQRLSASATAISNKQTTLEV